MTKASWLLLCISVTGSQGAGPPGGYRATKPAGGVLTACPRVRAPVDTGEL